MHSNPFQQVVRATRLRSIDRPSASQEPWTFGSLVGRLSELSEERSEGALSLACSIVAEAQRANEPVAWVAPGATLFYPSDLAESGIDVQAIAILRLPGARAAILAAEWLLRSGAFGLLVLDLGSDFRIADAPLGRLARLAERGASAVLFLTRKSAGEQSIGSMISLRAEVHVDPAGCRGSRAQPGSEASPVALIVHTVKDKRGAPEAAVRRLLDGSRRMY